MPRRRVAASPALTRHSFGDALPDVVGDAIQGHALLLQRVPIPDCCRIAAGRVTVDRDAERRSDLVLAAVPAPDRAGLVIEHRERWTQLLREALSDLRHPVLLHEREDSGLDRSERRVKSEHDAPLIFSLDLLLAVAVHEQREQRAVRPDGRLDDVRHVPPIVRLVEVLELLSRELLMLREIVISAIVDTLDLLEAEVAAEVEVDVEGGPGVVRELIAGLLVELEPALLEPQPAVPRHALVLPVLEPFHVGARLDEELHLHLLEF